MHASKEPRFRVSDASSIPLRGYLLRLKLLEGRAELKWLKPGRALRVVSPKGDVRVVTIRAFSITGGRATQKGLDEIGLLDVLIDEAEARNGSPIGLGWIAAPAREHGER